MHEIYETAHRRRGENAMRRRDFATAVKEFERPLRYPKILGAGKPKSESQHQLRELLARAKAAAATQPAS